MTHPHLSLRDVEVSYGHANGAAKVAIARIDLEVPRSEFLALLGPSGCGKSTLLLAIDGLLKPSRGEVLVNDQPVKGPGTDRAMVFQEVGLLPWRNVVDNIAFGLQLNKQPGVNARARARELVRFVGLEGFEDYHPHQLSGGMRQRVGIARALAVSPEVLLMDEPFGALDAQTRELMGVELLKIWEHERKTVLFVTHSIDEAIYLADRVVVLSKGPAVVREVVDIDLPRPRTSHARSSAEYTEYRERLSSLLFSDVPSRTEVLDA